MRKALPRTAEEAACTRRGAFVLVHRLSALSAPALLAACIALGRPSIVYSRATRWGLRAARCVWRLGFAGAAPVPIGHGPPYVVDTPFTEYWDSEVWAQRLVERQRDRVAALVDRALPGRSVQYRAIACANVLKSWTAALSELAHLERAYAGSLAHEALVPPEAVRLVSPAARLRRLLAADAPPRSRLIGSPSWRESPPAVLAALGVTLRRPLMALAGSRRARAARRIGVAAVWGHRTGRSDDLFWWRRSGIPPSELLYVFDAAALPASREAAGELAALGIESVATSRAAAGELPGVRDRLPVGRASDVLRAAAEIGRMALAGVRTGPVDRSALATLAWQHAAAERLAPFYRERRLAAVFNRQESGADYVAAAAESAGAIRVGVAWSTLDAPCEVALRTHHVYFCWGRHDACVCLDSGTVSPHVLLCGSPMHAMRTSAALQQRAARDAAELRSGGATKLLALFDSSLPVPSFYRFFLRWVLDDPALGLLVKSKCGVWAATAADGLDGLVRAALATGRVRSLPDEASPGDAALACDFAVGITSLSAVMVAALAGARVLYLDYERLHEGPAAAYATLHRLGVGRCVFSDPEALRLAVDRYFQNPGAHGTLGDATPVLDSFDPFRDGAADRRVGEYLKWFLEGLDAGLGRDAALAAATERYAARWGADKVLRGPNGVLRAEALPSAGPVAC